MSTAKKEMKRLRYGMIGLAGSFIGLGLFKLTQFISGMEEAEFYDKYPASWWIVVSLGFLFIASLFYVLKCASDLNSDLQLGSRK